MVVRAHAHGEDGGADCQGLNGLEPLAALGKAAPYAGFVIHEGGHGHNAFEYDGGHGGDLGGSVLELKAVPEARFGFFAGGVELDEDFEGGVDLLAHFGEFLGDADGVDGVDGGEAAGDAGGLVALEPPNEAEGIIGGGEAFEFA